ncbi:molecular chaperone [Coemansia sp. RSA 1933]|nr:molecular chaperone [Coemansia sp. RSA 1933]
MFRFGLESLIGIIPIIGDFAGVVAALILISCIRKHFDLPAFIVTQMFINIAIDFAVGLVPILGDIVDMLFKANMRNYSLVKDYVEKRQGEAAAMQLEAGMANGYIPPQHPHTAASYIPHVTLQPGAKTTVAKAALKNPLNWFWQYYRLPIQRSIPINCNYTCHSDRYCEKDLLVLCVLCDNPQCKIIQPVGKGVTYHDVLLDGGQHSTSFDVDVGQLRRNFLKLQQLVHPDSFSQMGDTERKLAEIQSSWVNHAYATLKDPLLRAFYILELNDKGIGEEDQITDPELLMEIMEFREEIEASETEKHIADIKERNDAKIDKVTNGIAAAFGAENYDSAKQLTHHLQYLRRVSQAIHSWEPGKPVIISH